MESGRLPTVTSFDATGSNLNGKHWNGISKHAMKIGQAIQRLPTPTVDGNYNRKGASATSGDGLATVVKAMERVPTPRATEGEKSPGGHRGTEDTLTSWVKSTRRCPTPKSTYSGPDFQSMERTGSLSLPTWVALSASGRVPTPTTQDAKNNNSPSQRDRAALNVTVGGPLNPEWVEWLMGWPIGWTDLKPLAMDKYRQWLNAHGKH